MFLAGFHKSREFFEFRFDGSVNFKEKTVVDLGCGYGCSCIYMAIHGARKVVGIDIDKRRLSFMNQKLASEFADLIDVVEFRNASEKVDSKFDLVLSQDAFEHYEEPEEYIKHMKSLLKEDGFIVIGFGPLWKSPYGGHINFMTKVPWAHLIFPESVIMAERKRFRPEENAKWFEQIRGGLNKMTFRRYLKIIKGSGLEFVYFKTNVSRNTLGVLFNILRNIPFFQEYFTVGVYSILRIKQ